MQHLAKSECHSFWIFTTNWIHFTPLLPTGYSLDITCLSCQGLKSRFNRFLDLVTIGFIEVFEFVEKSCRLAQFGNSKKIILRFFD
jgi:hypothetical protein